MSQKSIALKLLDKAITSDDLLGKDVIDLGGKFIGISEKVLIDPDSLDFIGIGVDKGFGKTCYIQFSNGFAGWLGGRGL